MKAMDKTLSISFALWLGVIALIVGLFGSAPANAQPYAFGFSSYDSNETLTLATTDGSVVLDTGRFQGWISNSGDVNEAGPDGNTNYFTGANGDVLYNDFFAFNITGLTPEYAEYGDTCIFP
jgi:hypothetical protein